MEFLLQLLAVCALPSLGQGAPEAFVWPLWSPLSLTRIPAWHVLSCSEWAAVLPCVTFKCGTSWVGSFPINVVIGQEKKKSELKMLFAEVPGRTKERKHSSYNELTGGWMENRGLLTCAPWAKWRRGMARDLDISVLLDVQEAIRWWDGVISVSERRSGTVFCQHEAAESLPLWLCCMCSLPKIYSFSCFVL